jgi:hypothetical protein
MFATIKDALRDKRSNGASRPGPQIAYQPSYQASMGGLPAEPKEGVLSRMFDVLVDAVRERLDRRGGGGEGGGMPPGMFGADGPRIVTQTVNEARCFVMGFGPVILPAAQRLADHIPPPERLEDLGEIPTEELSPAMRKVIEIAKSNVRYYQDLIQRRSEGMDDTAPGSRTAVQFANTPQLAQPQTIIFSMQPQLPFRPSGILFTADSLDRVWINDVKVGKNSALLSNNPVPAKCVHELTMFDIDTCNVGQRMTLSVSNYEEKEIFFGGLFFGTAMQ